LPPELSKMKPLMFVNLISLLLAIGCNEVTQQAATPSYLDGDWASKAFKDDWSTSKLVFSFQDTAVCSYLRPYVAFTPYCLKGDTLVIDAAEENYVENATDRERTFRFLVNRKAENKITLQPLNLATKKLLYPYKEMGVYDGLELTKMTPVNNYKFDRIAFYSTFCYGTCPVMYLEIDAQGNLLFHGLHYTGKDGFYKGKLGKKEIDLINKKLNAIHLDSLEKHYSAGWTDDQTCGMRVQIGHDIFESSAYGIDEEPVELRFLLQKLMLVYEAAELRSDSTVVYQFQFKDFSSLIEPPPAPAPAILNK